MFFGIPVALALCLSVGPAGTRASAGPISGREEHPSAPLEVWVSGDDLTVDAREAPLGRVLRTVGARAGVDVTLRGDFSTPITESFANVPLEEGIRRLARGYSVAVTYASSLDAPRRGRLTGVWVIGRSPSRAIEPASESPPRSPRHQGADQGVPEATVHVPDGGWIEGIQALADEAGRGSGPAVERLATLSASEPNAVVRHQAVAALARFKGPEIEPALTAALADDDVSVRLRAVRGLRGTGTETSLQSLTSVLIGDADAQVRLAALRALASLPGPAMLQGLTKATSDPDDRVRETATRGLAWWTTLPRGTH